MCYVIDLVLVEADRFDQINLDFVRGDDAAQKIRPAASTLLPDRDQWRDVVTRVRIIGSQKGIMHVQLANGSPIRPSGPFGFESLLRCDTEYGRAAIARMHWDTSMELHPKSLHKLANTSGNSCGTWRSRWQTAGSS